MVTFNCEICNDTVPKKKTETHYYKCPDAYYTCIDCSKTFDGWDYQKHTSCISEDEKYQKALYKGPKQQKQQKQQPKVEAKPEPKKEAKPEPKKQTKESFNLKQHKGNDLYKVTKSMSKDEKKDLLKRLIINEDGSISLK